MTTKKNRLAATAPVSTLPHVVVATAAADGDNDLVVERRTVLQ